MFFFPIFVVCVEDCIVHKLTLVRNVRSGLRNSRTNVRSLSGTLQGRRRNICESHWKVNLLLSSFSGCTEICPATVF